MKSKIRKECAGKDCDNKLPGTEKYFKTHGNFCRECNKKFTTNSSQPKSSYSYQDYLDKNK